MLIFKTKKWKITPKKRGDPARFGQLVPNCWFDPSILHKAEKFQQAYGYLSTGFISLRF